MRVYRLVDGDSGILSKHQRSVRFHESCGRKKGPRESCYLEGNAQKSAGSPTRSRLPFEIGTHSSHAASATADHCANTSASAHRDADANSASDPDANSDTAATDNDYVSVCAAAV
jgi:hypothetical protein